MKQFTLILMLALMASVTVAGNTGLNSHGISIVDEHGQRVVSADIFQVEIFIPDTETRATIYKQKAKTDTITQPITSSSTNTPLSNSVVNWWGPDGYDIRILYKGQVVNKKGLDSSNGSVRINTALTKFDGTDIKFDAQPLVLQEDGTVASGVDTEINVANVGAEILEYININTQTILVPNIVATGLDIARDLTDTDGTEYTQGILASSKSAFTVGTSPAFYFRLKFTLTDVSGTDVCVMGFRKAEAYQATHSDYDEAATLNVLSGDITIESILNTTPAAGVDTTDNWADLATKTLQVNVSAAGVVTYLIDGVAPTVTAAFTFDDAEVVLPYFYMIHDADVAESTILIDWEVGLQ